MASPSEAPLVADDQLLVIMTVDIGNGKSCAIHVRQGDDPVELANRFVEEQELDPNAVIAEVDGAPVVLLSMLIDHIRHNKQAAYERVCASIQHGHSTLGVGDDGDLSGADFESDSDHVAAPSFDEEYSATGSDHVVDVVEEAPAPRFAAGAMPPPLPFPAGFAPAPAPSHAHASDDGDSEKDDNSLSGHAASVMSNTSSMRRLMGTEEEREVQYMALKSQFAGTGKSARRSRGAAPPSTGRRSPQRGGPEPVPARRPRGSTTDIPLPRVATLKTRQSSPDPPAPPPKPRKARPLTADEEAVFARLHQVCPSPTPSCARVPPWLYANARRRRSCVSSACSANGRSK